MKKIITGFLTICCILTMQAAMNYGVVKCTDVEKIKNEMQQLKASHMKAFYEFHLMYLANPKIVDDFESFKKAAKEAAIKHKWNENSTIQLITYLNPNAKKYQKQAYNLNPNNPTAMQYLLFKVYNIETTEGWNAIANQIIFTNCDVSSFANNLIIKLTRNDLNIPKDKKIEVYSKLYEKWYMELAGKNKDRYIVPVTMIAMKLKSLGVDVNK